MDYAFYRYMQGEGDRRFGRNKFKAFQGFSRLILEDLPVCGRDRYCKVPCRLISASEAMAGFASHEASCPYLSDNA